MQAVNTERKFLSRREAAVILGMSERTLDRRLRDGSIVAVRMGIKLLIPITEIKRIENTTMAVVSK